MNLLAKLIFTIAIFIFIKKEGDYYIVPILTSSGYIAAGISSLIIIHRKLGLKFQFQNLNTIKYYLVDGWYVFLANLSNGLYSNSTIMILGFFTNTTLVGYYSAGERLIKIIQSSFTPLFQSFFPYIAGKAKESITATTVILRKMILLIGGAALVVSIIVFILAEFIVAIALGDEFTNTVIIVKILSLLPLTYCLSNILGVQTMLNFKKNKAYSRIFIFAFFINLTACFIFIPTLKEKGTAIASLITELFFVTSMLTYLQLSGIKIVGTTNKKKRFKSFL